MTDTKTLNVGDIVRPACDGESIAWTKMRGRITDLWMDGNELRAEVSWFGEQARCYGRRLPAYLIVRVRAQ